MKTIKVDVELVKEIKQLLLLNTLAIVNNIIRPISMCANCGYKYAEKPEACKWCKGHPPGYECAHFLEFPKLDLDREFAR